MGEKATQTMPSPSCVWAIAPLVLFLTVLTVPSVAEMTKVDLTAYPAAVCNDGSTAAYYWKPAPTNSNGVSTWLMYLQGGGWCSSNASCNTRATSKPDFMSSATWADTYPENGIFNATGVESTGSVYEDRLQNANKVFVRYCTSDAHMGNAENWDRQFRGAEVVQAVLTDLVANKGLGSSKAFMLFGGGSAGSRGAMVHLDYVPSMLGTAASQVEVVGFMDSPLYLDIADSSGYYYFGNESSAVFDAQNISHTGTACAATYTGTDSWKCIFGQYRIPTITTPFFLVASLYDWYQLLFDLGIPARAAENPLNAFLTDSDKTYAENFASKTKALAKSIQTGWSGTSSYGAGVLAWDCYNHMTSVHDNGFNEFTCAFDEAGMTTTMHSALFQYLGWTSCNSASPTNQWIADCVGFACGTPDPDTLNMADVVAYLGNGDSHPCGNASTAVCGYTSSEWITVTVELTLGGITFATAQDSGVQAVIVSTLSNISGARSDQISVWAIFQVPT